MTLADKLKAKIHELTDQYLDADARSLRAFDNDDANGAVVAEAEIYVLRGVLADLRRAHAYEVLSGGGMIILRRVIESAKKAQNKEIAIRLQSILDGFSETETAE